MSLKLKSNISLEALRKFGFAPGSELAGRPEYAAIFRGCDYQLPWWHKFEMDPDNPTMPYSDDDGNPLVHAWVDTRDGINLLWFDVIPCCTYHAEMDDLDIITDTIFAMTTAGLLEMAEEKC